jgi:hypothetical protein
LAVAMQPEQATATAIISTNDLIRLSPEGKVSAPTSNSR